MIKIILKVLIFTAILSTLSMARKEALVIGVEDYQGEINDLDGIERDINNIKSLFEKWGFHVTMLFNGDSMKIDEYLQKYHTLNRDDVFAFYYSGHGSQTDDISGDEKDGKDETIVLSDGRINKHYIDDDLYTHFNQIRAKKLIIFDSCHSGTAFKRFGDKPKPKSINPKFVSGTLKSKSFRHQDSQLNGGEYIVFSASQDREESLATKDGSLFTNSFIKEFSNGGDSKDLMNIKQSIEQDIYNYCQQTKSTPHHPKMSTSSDNLRYSTINKFLKTISNTQPVAKKSISILGKKRFRDGELLSFKIDTNGNRGYLTILSIEDGKPFIMTKTDRPVQGILNFQQDFDIKPTPIECYKSCKNCPEEVSRVYVILSAKPITKNLIESKGLIVNGGIKSFRHRINDAYKPIIAKAEFTIY